MTAKVIYKGAHLSTDRKYRYSLARIWDSEAETMMVVGLNPSTADENIDDPTIRRCIRFARDTGHGGLIMVNLFALRSTDPSVLTGSARDIGPENDLCLRMCADISKTIVVAWGTHPVAEDRALEVYKLIGGPVVCLGTTKSGMPRHPLYVKASQPLLPWVPA